MASLETLCQDVGEFMGLERLLGGVGYAGIVGVKVQGDYMAAGLD